MSIFQTDLVFYSAFSAALADLRRNVFVIDDAYSNLRTDPFLRKLYGEKEVERLKNFLTKEISIFVEHRTPDLAKFPSISIRCGGGHESEDKDALGDSFQQERVDPDTLGGAYAENSIIIGPVTPQSYDPLTGTITFSNDIDLSASNVFDTQYVYDSVNQKYYHIELVLDSSNLLIEPNSKPNLTNMLITKSKKSLGHVRRSIWFWETNSIDLMATSGTDVMYLFTIVMIILVRYKKQLFDARNYAASSISYSELMRISPQDDPNNVYGRTITIRGRVENNAIESTHPLIGGVNMDFKIADMTSPQAVLNSEIDPLWIGEGDANVNEHTNKKDDDKDRK